MGSLLLVYRLVRFDDWLLVGLYADHRGGTINGPFCHGVELHYRFSSLDYGHTSC